MLLQRVAGVLDVDRRRLMQRPSLTAVAMILAPKIPPRSLSLLFEARTVMPPLSRALEKRRGPSNGQPFRCPAHRQPRLIRIWYSEEANGADDRRGCEIVLVELRGWSLPRRMSNGRDLSQNKTGAAVRRMFAT